MGRSSCVLSCWFCCWCCVVTSPCTLKLALGFVAWFGLGDGATERDSSPEDVPAEQVGVAAGFLNGCGLEEVRALDCGSVVAEEAIGLGIWIDATGTRGDTGLEAGLLCSAGCADFASAASASLFLSAAAARPPAAGVVFALVLRRSQASIASTCSAEVAQPMPK